MAEGGGRREEPGARGVDQVPHARRGPTSVRVAEGLRRDRLMDRQLKSLRGDVVKGMIAGCALCLGTVLVFWATR